MLLCYYVIITTRQILEFIVLRGPREPKNMSDPNISYNLVCGLALALALRSDIPVTGAGSFKGGSREKYSKEKTEPHFY